MTTNEIQNLAKQASATLPSNLLGRRIEARECATHFIIRVDIIVPARRDPRRKLIRQTQDEMVRAINKAIPGGDWAYGNEYWVPKDRLSAAAQSMRIEYTDGNEIEVVSEAAAREILDAKYPNAEFGDWEQIGYAPQRMLVWASEREARNDNGARAVAVIVIAKEAE